MTEGLALHTGHEKFCNSNPAKADHAILRRSWLRHLSTGTPFSRSDQYHFLLCEYNTKLKNKSSKERWLGLIKNLSVLQMSIILLMLPFSNSVYKTEGKMCTKIKEYCREIFYFVSRHLVVVGVRHNITAALQYFLGLLSQKFYRLGVSYIYSDTIFEINRGFLPRVWNFHRIVFSHCRDITTYRRIAMWVRKT